ncbi:MAG: chitobiase/beta-hexosaminidase C-terminal domain-containing protein [Lachnospiraceae bacterium]|jgi:hypothetical protein|nr:chitobiase/beta-hexosaminidase C-terminal domain-containing protein [Lachnospiraceae bacterium]
MRKLIVTMLLTGTLALSAAINYPSMPYVLDAVQLEYSAKLPANLQTDLLYALNSAETPLALTLSHQEFFYDENISVSIQASNPEAESYYTLDCSTPSDHSKRYVGPLTLENRGGGNMCCPQSGGDKRQRGQPCPHPQLFHRRGGA